MNVLKRLRKEQVENMYNMALMGTTGHLVVAALALTIFYSIIPHGTFYIFIAIFVLAGLYRYFIVWRYYNTSIKETDLIKWVFIYTSGIVITAFIWSFGTIYIVNIGIPLEYEFLLFSIIIGIGASGIATFGMIFFAYMVYVVALLVPYGIFLFYEFDKFHLISGILVLIALPYFLRASYGYTYSFSNLIDRNKRLLEKEKKFSDATLNIMIKVLEEKDLYTVGHAERVSNYCVDFAKKINLSEDEIEKLRRSAYLHDIGKIMIPDDILTKTGPLTDKEYEIIKSHPQKGYDILRMADNEIIDLYLPSIKHHHERYDGLGYPDALAKDEIPFFARIISIVDTYDAMTSTRSYRKALSIRQAINEISRGKGKQFDPELSDIFLEIITEKSNKKEKISKFIKELEQEHDEILDMCSEVREKYPTDREGARKQLQAIKNLLIEHLQKEDKYLYPPLLKIAENNKDLKKSLDFFVKNIAKVSDMFDAVLRIFSENDKDDTYYEEHLNKLAILLNERIKKEEGIIFSMYEEKVSDIV